MRAQESPARLLVRHFVRRFVDNDLLSAHVDRHESLGFFGAMLVAAGTFAAVLLGQKYIFGAPSISWVAIMVMEDRFVMIAVSMIVVALTTAAQWDALSLDARDAAILGPLPIGHAAIVRAKAGANGVFALAVVAAVAVGPSIMYSLFAVATVPLSVGGAVRVTAAHLAAVAAAVVFAFLAVAAVRELLRLVAGARVFAAISTSVQSLLLVGLTTLLLLAVGSSPGVSRTWLTEAGRGGNVTPFAVPPMWFVGLAETLTGDVIVLAPVGGVVRDDDLSRLYLRNQPLFHRLGLVGIAALAGTLVAGGGAYLWNARRLPEPPARARSRRRRLRLPAALAMRLVVGSPVARAGFFFTLRVLLRSAPQRVAMAVGVAVALSLAIAIAGSAGLRAAPDAASVPLSVWALQPLVVIVLLAAFRHAMAVPAELRANWVFHQCWPGRLREYLGGVERAAMVAVAAPAVLALLPAHLYVLGPFIALFHAANGIVLAAILLTLSTSASEAPPFVSSYVPRGNVMSLGPALGLIVLAFAFSAAALERASAGTARGILLHTLLPIGILAGVRIASARGAARMAPLAADAPEPVAQTLGLSE